MSVSSKERAFYGVQRKEIFTFYTLKYNLKYFFTNSFFSLSLFKNYKQMHILELERILRTGWKFIRSYFWKVACVPNSFIHFHKGIMGESKSEKHATSFQKPDPRVWASVIISEWPEFPKAWNPQQEHSSNQLPGGLLYQYLEKLARVPVTSS